MVETKETAVEAATFSEEVLDILIQGTNGDKVYSNKRALFGYLPSEYNLAVPSTLVPTIAAIHGGEKKPNVDLKVLGKIGGVNSFLGEKGSKYVAATEYLYINERLSAFKIAAINYVKLTTAGKAVKEETACLVASLRARWVLLGCVFTDSATAINDPSKAFQEVDVVVANAAGTLIEKIADANTPASLIALMKANAPKFLDLFKSDEFGISMAVKIAEAVWCISEYLFRTRGHHFKPAFVPLIKKILSSAFEGTETLSDNTEWEHIFHTAIHPFGVRMLPVMSAHFIAHGKVGNALIIRMNAAPNGTAAITTSRAVLDVVATEPWYNNFVAAFKDQISVCKALSDVIMDDKYSFSMAANLYGLERVHTITVKDEVFTLEGGKSQVGAIATVGQGLINALKAQKEGKNITGFSFENAKALEKHAGTNPMLAVKVMAMVNMSLELIDKAKSMDEAASMAFPILIAD